MSLAVLEVQGLPSGFCHCLKGIPDVSVFMYV